MNTKNTNEDVIVNLSLQEIFDKVAVHLLTQKVKAMDHTEECKYQQPIMRDDGTLERMLKCAGGAIIPDEYYLQEYEGTIFSVGVQRISRERFGLPMVTVDNENLVIKLQVIHDHKLVIDWKICLANLAQQYKLNSEILNQFS